MTALNLDWRAGSKKIVVQIGDAPAKDPEPITGLTLRAIQLKALSVDPATVDTIQSRDETDTRTSFAAISSATGGAAVQLAGLRRPDRPGPGDRQRHPPQHDRTGGGAGGTVGGDRRPAGTP